MIDIPSPGTRVRLVSDDKEIVRGVVVQVNIENPGMVHVRWDGDSYVCVLLPEEIQEDISRVARGMRRVTRRNVRIT